MFSFIENDTVLSLTIAALSLWKVYSGAMIAAVNSMSYLDMLAANLITSTASAYLSWQLSGVTLKRLNKNSKPKFNPKLKKLIRLWKKYGQLITAFLAPVLIGIPVYSALSRHLSGNKTVSLGLILISIVFWVNAIYFITLHLGAEIFM
jgi:hypothetical protein